MAAKRIDPNGLPDTNSPEFAAEARRESQLIAESPWEAEDQAFVDAISEFSFAAIERGLDDAEAGNQACGAGVWALKAQISGNGPAPAFAPAFLTGDDAD